MIDEILDECWILIRVRMDENVVQHSSLQTRSTMRQYWTREGEEWTDICLEDGGVDGAVGAG